MLANPISWQRLCRALSYYFCTATCFQKSFSVSVSVMTYLMAKAELPRSLLVVHFFPEKCRSIENKHFIETDCFGRAFHSNEGRALKELFLPHRILELPARQVSVGKCP